MATRRRARTERRELARSLEKVARASEKVAALEPGGEPARPLLVPSASVIESRAASHRCLACDGELRVHEHRAARDLREVELVCKACGRHRTLWFRVSLPS